MLPDPVSAVPNGKAVLADRLFSVSERLQLPGTAFCTLICYHPFFPLLSLSIFCLHVLIDMYGLFFCWIFQPIVNIFYHMYDQIPIFIIRQKTAAPFLIRQPFTHFYLLYCTFIHSSSFSILFTAPGFAFPFICFMVWPTRKPWLFPCRPCNQRQTADWRR